MGPQSSEDAAAAGLPGRPRAPPPLHGRLPLRHPRKKLLLLQLAFWLVGIKDDNTTAPYPEPLSDQLDKSIVGGGLQLFEFSDHNAGFEVPGTFPPSHFDSASGMAPLPIKLRAIALATLAKTFTKTISIVAHGSLINKHVIVKN